MPPEIVNCPCSQMLVFTHDSMSWYQIYTLYNICIQTLLQIQIKRFGFRAHVVQTNYVVGGDARFQFVLKNIVLRLRGAYGVADLRMAGVR